MWIAILLLLLWLVGVLLAVGLPKARLVRSLSILTWPPRIRPIVIHPEAEIRHEFANRVFFGHFKLPRSVYLNDSKIVSASIEAKWQSQSQKRLK
jgi:hypothetical protein